MLQIHFSESVISVAPDPSNTIAETDIQDDPEMTNHKNHIYDPTCKICNANNNLQELSSPNEVRI